ETGYLYLTGDAEDALLAHQTYLTSEVERQRALIAQWQRAYRRGIQPAAVAGRSVILVDDGVATGSTMRAALRSIQAQHPKSIILAAPVMAAEAMNELHRAAPGSEVIAAAVPPIFVSVPQAYCDFSPVDDDMVTSMLRGQRDHRMKAV